eukprot:CAMPEP_0113687420 /NCGR_PEP_ID=MMETSP0038_2-20120614/15923_1 /TAXON_ID=2898 /ORGANISM="Cryptomonas paramecium" /LENGTH=275 /DNA_ID=CAMNT_0000608027 /DNA_START=9 /DNA_END=833 /DNA_ORIENTATION=+ /assembly_acc=CAM_ASM_000170
MIRGRVDYKGKHVLITGGSEGIGKAMAKEFVRRGANVTIVARTESKLIAAQEEIKKLARDGQIVRYAAADVSNFEIVNEVVKTSEAAAGPIFVLVANAGSSVPGYFLEQDPSVFEQQMRVNYLGVVHAAKAAAPGMTAPPQRPDRLVASAAAVISFIGYSAYAPTKWALRGLADALRNELCGFGVSVHVAYPPDTATSGFDRENQSKPAECSAFSAFVGGAPFSPEAVAKSAVLGLEQGLYHLPSPDFMQNRLVDTMAGVSPRNNAVLEWTLMPL